MLPLLPPLALIAGRLWGRLTAAPAAPAAPAPSAFLHRAILGTQVAVVLGLAGGSVYLWTDPPQSLHERYGVDLRLLAAMISVTFGVSVLGLLAVRWQRYRLHFASLASISASLMLFFTLVLAPQVDPYRSTRELARALDRVLPPGEPIPVFFRMKDSCLFYTDRLVWQVHRADELERYFSAPHRRVFCLADRKESWLLEKMAGTVHVVDQIGAVYLLSNREGPWRPGGRRRQRQQRPVNAPGGPLPAPPGRRMITPSAGGPHPEGNGHGPRRTPCPWPPSVR